MLLDFGITSPTLIFSKISPKEGELALQNKHYSGNYVNTAISTLVNHWEIYDPPPLRHTHTHTHTHIHIRSRQKKSHRIILVHVPRRKLQNEKVQKKKGQLIYWSGGLLLKVPFINQLRSGNPMELQKTCIKIGPIICPVRT